MTSVQPVLGILAVAIGIVMSPEATAATRDHWMWVNAAQSCQLNKPTIDTVVAPRATGFTNPGTTGAFVICGLARDNELGIPFINANIFLASLDGASHSITCTGVAGLAGLQTQAYVAKSGTVPGTGYVYLNWASADFGGSGSMPGTEFTFSITCNLPPQTQITAVNANYNVDIGA